MKMTVKDLKEALANVDDDLPVFFTYNYGDHSRTAAAEQVRRVEEDYVCEWPYGNCYRRLDHDDEPTDTDASAIAAVILL